MARSTVSLGMPSFLARSSAIRSRTLPSGLGPPSRVATYTSRASLENIAPRFESLDALSRLICAHLECPAMMLSPTLMHGAGGQIALESAPDEPICTAIIATGWHHSLIYRHRVRSSCTRHATV